MATEKRLLVVHAHPDDEASKGAGTAAKYAQQGRVRIVTCTGGERGDILNPYLKITPELEQDLVEVRRGEMAAAAAALGVEHTWLGFIDSGLPTGDPLPPVPEGSFAAISLDEPIRRLTAEIREFRPQVLICYDESGGYPHPDHIRAHEVAVGAYRAAADANYAPELGEPWQITKVYYDISLSRRRMRALHEGLLARGKESPLEVWFTRHSHEPRPEELPASARIDVAEFFSQRDAALRAHQTQISPDSTFFAVPRDIEAEIWPWEEFHLAFSQVGMPKEMESDLFARIAEIES
ncbi:mycothiol conjugate amidase Mca [uncultured Arcanobacterium sp.]|uniref:mycothiol conjugate amidase Mca n=1 Tax=uncultured Arcanobacterium sp. TaxID=487520 RepID=UPI00262FA136|nr:mycothiol conjugate amidase Mca [uncultured Arcanobacterium sp.]